VFRWKLVAGFASVVAVVAVGTLTWSLAVPPAPTLPSAQMAAAPVPVVAPAAAPAVAPTGAPAASVPPAVVAAGVILRDPQLDAFLQAHRDAGGPSALQMPAGFLRNATFEGPAR
jgi:sigma-E factor negative regulatory protein RseA